jgi:hypothetical protein
MAERFRAEFVSYEGNDYTLKIYDNDHVGAHTSIDISKIIATTEASDNEIYTPIISAKLEVGIRFDYNGASDLLQFFEDVSGEQEDRFGCILTLTGGSEPVFVGVLRLDAIKIPNSPYGSVDLTFLDGLSLLKDIEYKNGSNFYDVETYENLLEHVQNCLEKLPTFDLYENGDDFLRNHITWYHTDMVTTSDDTLDKARCRHSEFTKVDEEGQYSAMTCFDVLEAILRRYLATLMYNPNPYSNYTIQHIRANTEATIDYVSYKKTRNALLSPSFNRDGGANTFLANGVYSFFPGINRIEVRQDWETVGIPTTSNSLNETDTFESLGFHEVRTANTRISFLGNTDCILDPTPITNRKLQAVFLLTIKIDDGVTPYYWERERQVDLTVDGDGFLNGSPEYVFEGEWDTVEKGHVLYTDFVRNKISNTEVSTLFNVVTKEISEVYAVGTMFEVSYKFEFVGCNMVSLSQLGLSNYGLVSYTRVALFSLIETDSTAGNQPTGKLTKSDFGSSNSYKIEYPLTLAFSDSVGNSTLQIRESSGDWVREVDKWKKSGASEYSLAELIIRDYYAMQKATIQKYQGSARGADIWANMRLTYSHDNAASDEVFIPIRTSHDLARDVLSGTFYKSAIFLGTPTIEDELIIEGGGSSFSSAANIPSSGSGSTSVSGGNQVVNVYELTSQTGTTITISDATIEDHTDLTDAEMDMLVITVKRGSTYLNYNRTSPNNVEYYAVQNGTDVDITLGRAAVSSDVFRILIKQI